VSCILRMCPMTLHLVGKPDLSLYWKKTGGRSLMDFPAYVATLNHRLWMNRLSYARDRKHSTMVRVMLPLDRTRVQELKG
jgi:hypothetical protein